MKKMLWCVLSVLAIALAGAACKKSSADLCSTKSKCEKEEAPSADKVKECQQMLDDKDCGPQARAMMECMLEKETCTPEGKTDMEATTSACSEPLGKLQECMKKKAPAPSSEEAPQPETPQPAGNP